MMLALYVTSIFFAVTQAALNEAVVSSFIPRFRSCCWGSITVPHGTVVKSIPLACLQLICHDGLIVTSYTGGIGSKDCCVFDDVIYADGDELEAQCLNITCKGGKWEYGRLIDDCCQHCKLYNDPHIETFDDFRYDYHGTCNYSLTQSDSSFSPHIGVFEDFKPCNSFASCLGQTTFRNDPNTIITLFGNSPFIQVNGDAFEVTTQVQEVESSQGPHPVLSWLEGTCLYFLGSSKLLVHRCRNRIDIWAYPSHTDKLDGLCGHFNFYQNDDFTNRNGAIHPLTFFPVAFPLSWKTIDQVEARCLESCPYSFDCKAEDTPDPCDASTEDRQKYRVQCRQALSRVAQQNPEICSIGSTTDFVCNIFSESCEFDLCVMNKDNVPEEHVNDWLLELVVLCQISLDLTIRTVQPAVP